MCIKLANTPAYHKKGKMEMFARLDNFGPFHVFFTLSCADYRWPENVTSILIERGIGLRCTINSDQTESFEVFSQNLWIPLENYMENEVDETLHSIMRRNIVTATRNYQQRVLSVMQTIVKNPSNPLSVKHFASKLEFAARGAGHNHGTLWLDIDKIEKKVDVRQLDHLKDHFSSTCKISENCYFLDICQEFYEDHQLKNPSDVQIKLDIFLVTRGMGNDR